MESKMTKTMTTADDDGIRNYYARVAAMADDGDTPEIAALHHQVLLSLARSMDLDLADPRD
jgi:hypothetical protein